MAALRKLVAEADEAIAKVLDALKEIEEFRTTDGIDEVFQDECEVMQAAITEYQQSQLA